MKFDKLELFIITLLLTQTSSRCGHKALNTYPLIITQRELSITAVVRCFFPGALSVVLIIVGPSPQESASIDFTSVVSLSFWPMSLFRPSIFSDTLTSLQRVTKTCHYCSTFQVNFQKQLYLDPKKVHTIIAIFCHQLLETKFPVAWNTSAAQETCMLCWVFKLRM